MDLKNINTPEELALRFPDIIPYLRDNERLAWVEIVPLIIPAQHPSALEALMKLTGAKTVDEIGEKGPPNAAASTVENQGLTGMDLYETLFGRDSLIVSHFLLPQFPKVAHATILALSARQGTRRHVASEEEVGKIMHEDRDPSSRIAIELHETRGWEFPYFGSVDATPLFITLITSYVQQEGTAILNETYTDRSGQSRQVAHALDVALSWMLKNMAKQSEGTLEFCRMTEGGLPIQAWKDSTDSYFHKDGTIANHENGIASIEVQAYAYDALLSVLELYHVIPQMSHKKEELEQAASLLKETVFSKMWIEDEQGGYFALGCDRDDDGMMRALEIRTSNMGHMLSSRLLSGSEKDVMNKRQGIVRTLMSKEMLGASGVRTLAKNEERFSPGSYHNGSVWLWDSYYVSRGFRRHGFIEEADELVGRMFKVIDKTHKYPEFVRGGDELIPELNARIVDVIDEVTHVTNRIEQPPQEIQAWTVAAILAAEYEKKIVE